MKPVEIIAVTSSPIKKAIINKLLHIKRSEVNVKVSISPFVIKVRFDLIARAVRIFLERVARVRKQILLNQDFVNILSSIISVVGVQVTDINSFL